MLGKNNLKILPFLLLVCLVQAPLMRVYAQGACAEKGQTPSGAFPLCGTASFKQETVPACPGKTMTVPGCNGSNAQYRDVNSFWYKFTCYQSGTLAFTITPNNPNDDYDWQLFDITGHQSNEVYTNSSLVVTGNWSGSSGPTGAAPGGVNFIQCASDPTREAAPTFSAMPNLVQGHVYLLMISHFTSDNQSGYAIDFKGGSANTTGTASITDPTLPQLSSATAVSCDGTQLAIKLSKPMVCTSLAANGSDFVITPGNIKVKAAAAPACNSGFDMDSIVLTLDATPPPGKYSVVLQKGTDGNTLLNSCDVPIPDGSSVGFEILPQAPTPMDSLVTVGCSPNILQLFFRKPMRCSSISPDGSDFTLTGPTPVSIVGAGAGCDSSGQTTLIQLNLSAPIQVKGSYRLQLKTGADGNTLIDMCGQETPAGSTLQFNTADTVSAAFTYRLGINCTGDTVHFMHDGRNGVNQWNWTFDGSGTSALQNPVKLYTSTGTKQVQLKVSNGVCTDSTTRTIVLEPKAKAIFGAPTDVCPQDAVQFTDSSTGHITSWAWNLGNGVTSTLQTPPSQQYNITARSQVFTVSLAVKDNMGCTDTAVHRFTAYNTCYIDVPTAFTPNGDGLNDYLYPLSGFKATQLDFRVYNRYGQLVFATQDWTKKWDGRVDGQMQPPGTYVWMLSYTHKDTGQKVFQKGTVVLIR
jgi:gliding motility-associated-like protein